MQANQHANRVDQLTALAQRLLDDCPSDLAAVATLGGSVAAGRADEFSDIEIHLWSEHPTITEDRQRFVDRLGATNGWFHEQPGKDGSEWMRFDLWGESFELGWQTTESFHQVVEALATGQPWGKGRIGLGWVITRGGSLRGEPLLSDATARLTPYSPALAHIVAGATIANQWRDKRRRSSIAAIARRDQWFRLSDELQVDALAVLRVVFAVNGLFEPPNWKWMEAEAEEANIAPADLVARIKTTLADVYLRPLDAARSMEELVRETIVLAEDISGFALTETGYA